MAKANRGSSHPAFPYEQLELNDLPVELLEAAHAWKWERMDDPKRSKMRAFRFQDEVLDANGEKRLVPCGSLIQIRYRIPVGGSIENGRVGEFNLPSSVGRWSYLMFDMDDPRQCLYTVMDENAKRHTRDVLWSQNPFAARPLAEHSRNAGGLQSKGWHPNVMVKPVGISTAVIYFATKKSDGSSNYIHRFGEESGVRPLICVDATGRIWFAGGDYTCPTAGITN